MALLPPGSALGGHGPLGPPPLDPPLQVAVEDRQQWCRHNMLRPDCFKCEQRQWQKIGHQHLTVDGIGTILHEFKYSDGIRTAPGGVRAAFSRTQQHCIRTSAHSTIRAGSWNVL